MTPEAFYSRLAADNRRVPGTHLLESGLGTVDLDWWQKQHPKTNLPDDFIALLRLHNGFCLHPDEHTPMGAIRLLPIREIDSASRRLYGKRRCESIPNFWHGITDHPDSARYLILDTSTGCYLDVSPIVPDEAEVVAKNVGE